MTEERLKEIEERLQKVGAPRFEPELIAEVRRLRDKVLWYQDSCSKCEFLSRRALNENPDGGLVWCEPCLAEINRDEVRDENQSLRELLREAALGMKKCPLRDNINAALGAI